MWCHPREEYSPYEGSSDLSQRLFYVFQKVVNIFNTYGDTDGAWGNAGSSLGRFIQLLVGGRCRMDNQGLGIPYVGQVRENVQAVDELTGCLEAVFQFNGENRYFCWSLWYGEDSRPG